MIVSDLRVAGITGIVIGYTGFGLRREQRGLVAK